MVIMKSLENVFIKLLFKSILTSSYILFCSRLASGNEEKS